MDDFLIQCDLYLYFNSDRINSDTDKVLYATTYLRGKAQQWIRPFLKDWLTSAADARGTETNNLFNSFDYFRGMMNTMFGEIDEKQRAQIEMEALKQRGSAANYSAEFQQLAFYTGYDDEALRRGYYLGLKDEVKDELMRTDTPKTFPLLVRLAIQLDERIYQRRKEKQGKQPSRFVPFKKISKTATKKPYYGPMLMEIDATQKQLPGKQQPKKAVKGNCYNCERPRHYSKQCRLPQKPRNGMTSRPGPSTKTVAATNQDHNKKTSHDALSWTACYNDRCLTHMSDKEGSGWFPREPRVRPLGGVVSDCASEEFDTIEEWEAGPTRICSMEQDMAYNEEFYQLPDKDLVGYGNDSEEEGEEPQPIGDPTAIEFEDEASTCFTLDMDPGEELYALATGRLQDLCRQLALNYPGFRTVGGNEIFQRVSKDLTKLLQLLLKEWENKLDRISSMYLLQNKNMLYATYRDASARQRAKYRQEFQIIEENIQNAWSLRDFDNIDYRDIVREHVPMGSRWTKDGGYITKEMIHIPRRLRDKVDELRMQYSEQALGGRISPESELYKNSWIAAPFRLTPWGELKN